MILSPQKRKSVPDDPLDCLFKPSSSLRSYRFDTFITARIVYFHLRSHAKQFEGEERVSMLRQRMCDLRLVSQEFKVNDIFYV